MGIVEKDKIKAFLRANRGYLKKGPGYIATRLGSSIDLIKLALQEVKKEDKNKKLEIATKAAPTKQINIITHKHQNVLIIGDLHSPWILEGYLEWCDELRREYKTNKTIFIGDVIDSGSWSYHEHNVDGMSVGSELDAAIYRLKPAYRIFPEAEITLGNHDLLIARKARTAGLSQRFIRDLGSVIEAPDTWHFAHEFKYHNVNYLHGSTGNAFTRAKDSRTSTVQGHLHSQSFLQYSVSEKDAVWGLQVGCGVNHKTYAFEYAKPMTKKPIISAGLVLENGTLPILRVMNL